MVAARTCVPTRPAGRWPSAGMGWSEHSQFNSIRQRGRIFFPHVRCGRTVQPWRHLIPRAKRGPARGIRVGQLARELNQEPRLVLGWLREHNQPYTHTGAQLPSEIEDEVRKHFEAGGAHVRGIPGRPTDVELPSTLTVRELADFLKVGPVDIIKDLFKNGIATAINQQIDFETAAIVADNFGVTALAAKPEAATAGSNGAESAARPKPELFSTDAGGAGNLKPRPPVVTVMGHVDHGKTSILDAIRSAKVAAGEAGGITQRVGAYQVEKNGKPITFIDTPGHEAFTAMRARGASITDVAVLVVAADDGVMPQTKEAIQHIKAAGVPMIVALNKIDKDNANPDKVKSELAENGVQIEEYGGEVPLVPVSAKEKIGLDDLLEMILLVIEIADLKANPDKPAAGTIIDAHLERGRGPGATVLVQTGTLRVGDPFVIGAINGRGRALLAEEGNNIEAAAPGQPAVVSALPDVPNTRTRLHAVHSTPPASRGMVIGWSDKVDEKATGAAEAQKVEIRAYDGVYHPAEDVEEASKGVYEPTFKEVWEGRAEIKIPIKVPKIGFIAGSQVAEGKISRNSVAKVYRGKDLLTETKISSLRRFKDDVREVAQGFACGIELEAFQDFHAGDTTEPFIPHQQNP